MIHKKPAASSFRVSASVFLLSATSSGPPGPSLSPLSTLPLTPHLFCAHNHRLRKDHSCCFCLHGKLRMLPTVLRGAAFSPCKGKAALLARRVHPAPGRRERGWRVYDVPVFLLENVPLCSRNHSLALLASFFQYKRSQLSQGL